MQMSIHNVIFGVKLEENINFYLTENLIKANKKMFQRTGLIFLVCLGLGFGIVGIDTLFSNYFHKNYGFDDLIALILFPLGIVFFTFAAFSSAVFLYEQVFADKCEELLKDLKENNLNDELNIICQELKKHGFVNHYLFKKIKHTTIKSKREAILKNYCPTGNCV